MVQVPPYSSQNESQYGSYGLFRSETRIIADANGVGKQWNHQDYESDYNYYSTRGFIGFHDVPSMI